jgi:hypothetical protein
LSLLLPEGFGFSLPFDLLNINLIAAANLKNEYYSN